MNGFPGVDLERLAGAYGHRREGDAAVRAAVAADAAALSGGDLAVDVGGGEGRHAAVFASRGARTLVVDRSRDMARAAAGNGIPAVVGDGAALPVAAGVARLVYFHLSLHHGDPERWLSEAARVVRPGGVVWVWTLAPEHLRASFLARWFPRVGEIDAARFPEPGDLVAALTRLGLAAAPGPSSVETVTRSAGSWVAAVEAGFVSTLHLLDADEMSAGLAAFADAHPDPAEEIDYELRFRAVQATRPSLPW